MKTFYIILVSIVAFTLVQGLGLRNQSCFCEPGPLICASNFEIFNGECALLCYNSYHLTSFYKISDGPCSIETMKNFVDFTRSQPQNQGLWDPNLRMTQLLSSQILNNKQQKRYNLLSGTQQKQLLDPHYANPKNDLYYLELQSREQKLVHILTVVEQLLILPLYQNNNQAALPLLAVLLKQLEENSPYENLLELNPQNLTIRQEKILHLLRDTNTLLSGPLPQTSHDSDFKHVLKLLEDINPSNRNQEWLNNNNNLQGLDDQQLTLQQHLFDLGLQSSRRLGLLNDLQLNNNGIYNNVNSQLLSDSQNLNNNRRLSNEHSQLLSDSQYLNNYIRKLSYMNSPLLFNSQNLDENKRRHMNTQLLSDTQNPHNNNRRSASYTQSLNNNERRVLNDQLPLLNQQLSVSGRTNNGNHEQSYNQDPQLSLRQKKLLDIQQKNLNVAINMDV